MQLDGLHLGAAGAAADEHLPKPGAGGSQRDVNVIVERFALHLAGLGALFRHVLFPHQTNHPVIEIIDLDRLGHGILVGEQALGQARG